MSSTFKVHILGCGSALPTLKHNASCQIVEIRGKFMMVDCAEGAQTMLRHTHVHFSKLQSVFISHLHGDHCFGLIGLISTFGLLGRTNPLHVYAPVALEKMLNEQITMFCPHLSFEVEFHAVDTTKNAVIYEDKSMTVTSIPLEHRMPCCGFLFREKPLLPHIRRDMIDAFNIPLSQINNIKAGGGWTTEDGTVLEHEQLVTPADPVKAYAYCSDTRYIPELYQQLQEVNVLYHESTYANDQIENAKKYCHSTAEQAAMVARDAKVERLYLGHYSSRYEDENIFLNEARAVFPESYLSNERMVIEL